MQKNRLGNFPTRFIIEPTIFIFYQNNLQITINLNSVLNCKAIFLENFIAWC